jgi:glutathione S-transferase
MTESENEIWIRKLRTHYTEWERTVPQETWMALARARNQALADAPRSRFRHRIWILSCATLALAAIGLISLFPLPTPGGRLESAHPEIVNATSRLLGRGHARLYEHLSFYRWLALHEKARLD